MERKETINNCDEVKIWVFMIVASLKAVSQQSPGATVRQHKVT